MLYGGGVLGLGFIRGVFSAPNNSSGLVGLSPGGGMLFAFFISRVAVAEEWVLLPELLYVRVSLGAELGGFRPVIKRDN